MWTCSFHHERMSAALPSGIFSGSAGSLRYMSSSVSAGAGGAGASSASSSSDLRGRSKMSWWEEPWRDSAADAGRSLPGAGAGAGAGAGGPAFLFVAAGFAGAAALRFVRIALDKLCRLARGQHSAEKAASQHPAEERLGVLGMLRSAAAPASHAPPWREPWARSSRSDASTSRAGRAPHAHGRHASKAEHGLSMRVLRGE